MATPGQLVSVYAELLGMAPVTVTAFDHALRDAGLRSKSGRGSGAAKVNARDAATLLVAILASPEIKSSALTVRAYASTHALWEAAGIADYRQTGLCRLTALPVRHSFVDLCEALVLQACDHLEDETIPFADLVQVTGYSTGTLGEVRLAGLANRRAVTVRYMCSGVKSSRRPGQVAASDGHKADARTSTQVTQVTIQGIARTLIGGVT